MAKKKEPSSEFMRILERQRRELERLAKPLLDYPKRMEKMVRPLLDYQQRTEKMTKPILEYQQKLTGEFKRFQEAWVQNIVETIESLMREMIEEQKKLAEEANKMLSDISLPDKVTEYIQNSRRIQEKWMDQLKKAVSTIEGLIKKRK
ncbi:MAG TPA: hypothetical protein VNK81_04210 [Thermodesulfobacteriota bacterium]|nr:hypothetical protein [Thermodesulfobacteriota bacterium]